MHRLEKNVLQVNFQVVTRAYMKMLKWMEKVLVTSFRDYIFKKPFKNDSKLGFELGGFDFLTRGVRG